MTGRKLGTYYGNYFPRNLHSMRFKLKDGINLKVDDIVTDDMVEDYKDPLVDKISHYLFDNICSHKAGTTCYRMAEEILDLINNKEK